MGVRKMTVSFELCSQLLLRGAAYESNLPKDVRIIEVYSESRPWSPLEDKAVAIILLESSQWDRTPEGCIIEDIIPIFTTKAS